MHEPVRIAVIPAAGLGTRNFTSPVIPKEMLTVFDAPVIQQSVIEGRQAGIEKFVFVISPGKEMIAAHFGHHQELEDTLRARGKQEVLDFLKDSKLKPEQVAVVYQDKPLGLGHAVLMAKDEVGGKPFAVLLPDEVMLGTPRCLEQMVGVYNQQGGNVVAVQAVPKDQTSRYGVLDVAGQQDGFVTIKGMVEKPKPAEAPSNLAIIGRYILQPSVFTHLEKMEKGAGGEVQLTDAMAKLLKTEPFSGFEFKGRRHDCGHLPGLLLCAADLALNSPKHGAEVRAGLAAMLQSPADGPQTATRPAAPVSGVRAEGTQP